MQKRVLLNVLFAISQVASKWTKGVGGRTLPSIDAFNGVYKSFGNSPVSYETRLQTHDPEILHSGSRSRGFKNEGIPDLVVGREARLTPSHSDELANF